MANANEDNKTTVSPSLTSSTSTESDTDDEDTFRAQRDNLRLGRGRRESTGPVSISRKRGSSLQKGSTDKITHFKSDSDPEIEPYIYDRDYDEYCRFTSIQRKIARHKQEVGSLSLLKAKYESLDYEVIESRLLLEEENDRGFRYIIKKQIVRWFVFLWIGLGTAVVGFCISFGIELATNLKYQLISDSIDEYASEGKLHIPYFIWMVTNMIPTFIGSVIVTYVEPIASGSGIPVVKCYLNGVNIPRLVALRTLFVKSIGVMCSIIGGLAGGNEGPMIHIGAIVSAVMATGKTKAFKKDINMFEYFREDREKRDFVSGGAAAGVAAAFSAPIGGVLFTLEEGSSFWNQSLTWRIFFASTICSFTINLIFNAASGGGLATTAQGMLNFGKFNDFAYEFHEIPIFILMGSVGGLTGALWVHINYKLNIFRIRFMNSKVMKVTEAVVVSIITCTAGMFSLYFVSYCRPIGTDSSSFSTQVFCGDGELNVLAALWLQTPEASVRSVFHNPANTQNMESLLTFLLIYYFVSCWTFGLSSSNGLFVPSLLTGAAWGRIIGLGLMQILPKHLGIQVNPSKYALIGAAAQLGGVIRMTLSLTVILMEATGSIAICFPVILTLIAAKWTGDIFSEGIYELVIQINSIPLLAWEPPPMVSHIFASEVMSQPPTTLYPVSTVKDIVEALKTTTYNGFPIIDPEQTVEKGNHVYGRVRGLILRSQLTVLLKNRLFLETLNEWPKIKPDLFRSHYPHYPVIESIELTDDELQNYTIDLRRYMNPSPYTLLHTTSLSRMFGMFRALGLRHLPIIDDSNHVIGMVTRKDIAKYRCWKHIGKMGVEELKIVY